MPEYTITMVGKTGNGKSALGNSILGKYGADKVFETSFCGKSTTHRSQKESAEVNGVRLHVIDTPGVVDTETDEKTTLEEIRTCRLLARDGVNALLLVTRCGQKFTVEDEKAINQLESLFGKQLFEYGIVIFTHGDEFETAKSRGEVRSMLDYLNSQPDNFKRLFDKFNKRYVLFDNKLTAGEAADRQRNKLVSEIRHLMKNKEPYRIPEVSSAPPCFPAASTVLIDHPGKHQGKMASLQIGTKVISITQDDSARAQLDTVYFFSHAAENVLAPFVRITTVGGKTLHLSEGHYIYVGKDALKTGALVTAREVKVGDLVHVVDALDQAPRAEDVIEVKTEIKRGLYCPHTMGGSLVVDGVCVSTYTEVFPPSVAHGLLWPIRALYRMAPNVAAKITQPQGDQGMPKWLQWLYDSYAAKV